MHLVEIAPGIDLQADVLDRMGFTPRMESPLPEMNSGLFKE